MSGSSPLASPKGAAVVRISANTTAGEVVGSHVNCPTGCTRSAALGVTRALTAPTPTAVSPTTVITTEQQMFPSAPACVPRTSTGKTISMRSEFDTSGRADSTLNMRQQQIGISCIIGLSSVGLTPHRARRVSSSAMTTTPSSGDGNSLRASLSRRGLSVHAAPFQPRSFTELSTLSSTLELPELGDLPSFRDTHLQKKESAGSIATSSVSVQQQGIRTTTLEFPRTPLPGETPHLRHSLSPVACSSVSAVRAPSSSSLFVGGGESLQRSTPLHPLSPSFSIHQQQRPVFTTGPSATSSSSGSAVCPPDVKDGTGSDNVRHLRVPFTDAEAMDEAAMLHLLRVGSGSSSGEDEDVVYMTQQQQQHQQLFDLATVLPTNFEVYHCAGGYWDLEGPRATPRLFLRRRRSSNASITVNAHSTLSSTCFQGNGVSTDRGGSAYADDGDDDDDDDDDDDLWEINSSAYADSLDEAQVEWIEEQLRAKENPDGFFF